MPVPEKPRLDLKITFNGEFLTFSVNEDERNQKICTFLKAEVREYGLNFLKSFSIF